MTQNQQAIIPFHGSALRAIRVDGRDWVALRPICDHLGIATNAQIEKLRQDEDFQLVSYPINSTDGKVYEMMCLPTDQLFGWLYGINSSRVSSAVRPLLSAYRNETTQAINDYWTTGQAVQPTTQGFRLPQTLSEALRLAAEIEDSRAALEQKALEDAPKVEGYEALMASSGLLSMKQVAAVLDIGIGDTTLYRWLREDGYLMDKKKCGDKDRHNLPYAHHIRDGLFDVKVQPWERGSYSGTASRTWVTSKGLDIIRRRYAGKKVTSAAS